MVNSIWDDIKFKLLRSNSVIIRLVTINVIAFLVVYIPVGLSALWGPETQLKALEFVQKWFFMPGDIAVFITKPWTFITHFFLHGFSLGHIFFNMLILYWFGRIFENLLGNRKTLSLFLFGGVVGGFAYMILSNLVPAMDISRYAVGASAAVMAMVVGTATLQPELEMRLILIGNVKLKWIAAFMVLTDVLFLADNMGGRLAHIAGASMGFLYVVQLRKGIDIAGWTVNIIDFFKAAFQRKPKSDFKVHRAETPRNRAARNPKPKPFREVSQAEIDAVLDKIASSGYDSLTPREKEILFKASNDK